MRSHGYQYPKDGFGFAGTALEVKAGSKATLKIKRVNVAERLYRITGGGIYSDSVLLGHKPPIGNGLLNGQVLGQDSAMAVVWRDRIWWFWGDTSRPSYPLGLFHMSGATAPLPGSGGLDPAVGIAMEYFLDPQGFCRAMCPMDRPGPVWIDGVVIAPDKSGQDRMVGHYARVKDVGQVLEHGVVVLDESTAVFRKRVEFDLAVPWRAPRGHPILWPEGDKRWFLFPMPYATVRAPAELEALVDPTRYEAFTCLEPGTRYDKATVRVARGADGRAVYGWKADTDPVGAAEEKQLIAAGKLRPDEARYRPRDVDSGKIVVMHSGSIRWNAFRKRWVMIAVESGGSSSYLGEVWFAEAEAPTGPWRSAKKVVTHDKYSFYNPVHDAFLDQEGGRRIYFEGTYTSTFSGNTDPTPRYDYNQVLYRLDLADPRLQGPPDPAAGLKR